MSVGRPRDLLMLALVQNLGRNATPGSGSQFASRNNYPTPNFWRGFGIHAKLSDFEQIFPDTMHKLYEAIVINAVRSRSG